MDEERTEKVWRNLGTSRIPKLPEPKFPNADAIVREGLLSTKRSDEAVDVLLVNPPTPDGSYWIRSQHRVGRRTRENMVWPQVSLAQMAALLHPAYKVGIIDANADRIGWPEFTKLLQKYQPRYYVTQLTAPTLENDMYGCFLAKARGAKTIVLGTHVTPIPVETMRPYPTLDFCLVGEPDITLRDLIDHLEGKIDQRPPEILRIFEKDQAYQPAVKENGEVDMHGIKGVAWRDGDEIVVNRPRPFVDLDDLPMPMHELLPL
ncbi:MAG: radical SAM protein, partial [Chloroflexi bacterium]|nr:radical SAM protein [Chloroflexota bacterium]